jgi:hypothetical protein
MPIKPGKYAMKKTKHLVLIAALAAALPAIQATTVIPPTFDQLVSQAELIFQGDVTDVRSEWVGEGAQRHIVSYVTFRVEEALKGSPGESYTIRMLGGTVDGETMGVSDAPKFQVGDKDILFVEHNGTQFIPLVGIMHGRFHVRINESGQEIVTTNEDEPVKNVARIGRAALSGMSSESEPDLPAAAFKDAVRSSVHPQQ